MDDKVDIKKDIGHELQVTGAEGDGGAVEMATEAVEETSVDDTGWKKEYFEEEEDDDDELGAVNGCSPLRCLLAVFCIRLPQRRDSCATSRIYLLPSRS